MKPRLKVSKAGIELLKQFEGYRATAAALPQGGWTIGYGHTKSARKGASIPENDAEALLHYDLIEVVQAVNDLTYTPLNQNQFDALVCFAFNVGLDNFRRSTVLRRVNEGALLQAACLLEMWRKAEVQGEKIVVDALVRRRAAEKAMFLEPMEGWQPAPSPLIQPRIDYDAAYAQPRTSPVNLVTSFGGEAADAREDYTARIDAALEGQAEPYSPAAAAAEAVAARIDAIILRQDAAPGDVSDAETAEPEQASLALTDGDAAKIDEVDAELVAQDEPIEASEPVRVDPDFEHAKPADLNLGPVFGTFLAGLIAFGFALFWGFSVGPSTDGLFGPLLVTWAAGLVGIGCVAAAVYMLLDRLGGATD